MSMPAIARKKRLVTWAEVCAFAAERGRDPTHVYRVIKKQRESRSLGAELEAHFGVPLSDLSFAGRTAA